MSILLYYTEYSLEAALPPAQPSCTRSHACVSKRHLPLPIPHRISQTARGRRIGLNPHLGHLPSANHTAAVRWTAPFLFLCPSNFQPLLSSFNLTVDTILLRYVSIIQLQLCHSIAHRTSDRLHPSAHQLLLRPHSFQTPVVARKIAIANREYRDHRQSHTQTAPLRVSAKLPPSACNSLCT